MRNVGAEWLQGAKVRMEGDGASTLLRYAAVAATEAAALVRELAIGLSIVTAEFSLVIGGMVVVGTISHASAYSEAPRVPVPSPAPRVRSAVPDVARIPVPSSAAEARLAPSADIVRVAARMLEVRFEDPKAGEALVAALEAAEACRRGPHRAGACRVEAPGVSFDIDAGVHVVGVDPDTGETAVVEGPGMIASQVDGVTSMDEDMIAALEDGEWSARGVVRTAFR